MYIEVGIACTVFGIILSYVGLKQNYVGLKQSSEKCIKEETKEDATETAGIKTTLSYILKGVDDIRLDIKAQDRKIEGMIERIARVEEVAKSAHKRIDEFEK